MKNSLKTATDIMGQMHVAYVPRNEIDRMVELRDKEQAEPDIEPNRRRLFDGGWGYCWGCNLAGLRVTEKLQAHHLSEWAEWDDADPDHVLALAQWWDPYGYATQRGD